MVFEANDSMDFIAKIFSENLKDLKHKKKPGN